MDKYPRESSPRELSATEAAGIRELTADEIDAVAGGLTLPVGIYTALSHVPSCAVPECRGISHADATLREALWDRFFTAAPRPRTPSELRYSDRRLRSKSSPAAMILIRKR